MKDEESAEDLEFVSLTSHEVGADIIPVNWSAEYPEDRGPVIATTSNQANRNAIGAHSGSYCIYKALAVAAGDKPKNIFFPTN